MLNRIKKTSWFFICILHSSLVLGESLEVTRVGTGPIIYPELDASIGTNIQGPSAIKVPDWVEDRLGDYYLYFADHKGRYIRLAYADRITGPWKIHKPGALQIEDSFFLTEPPQVNASQEKEIRAYVKQNKISFAHDIIKEVTAPHIASPDVIVDERNRKIVMFFHGLQGIGDQVTRVATSDNGVNFLTLEEKLGKTYWRSFEWADNYFGLAMPGQFYRSRDLLTGYESGPLLFNVDMRHNAVLIRNDRLFIFWTQVGEVPESIKLSTIDLTKDWNNWRQIDHGVILRPETSYEGADEPLVASIRSTAYGQVNQLRDPAILEDDGKIWLLYAIAGESGIALARVDLK